MTMLHSKMVATQQSILAESAAEKLESLKQASRYETFKTNIEATTKQYFEGVQAVDSELDMPVRVKPPDT